MCHEQFSVRVLYTFGVTSVLTCGHYGNLSTLPTVDCHVCLYEAFLCSCSLGIVLITCLFFQVTLKIKPQSFCRICGCVVCGDGCVPAQPLSLVCYNVFVSRCSLPVWSYFFLCYVVISLSNYVEIKMVGNLRPVEGGCMFGCFLISLVHHINGTPWWPGLRHSTAYTLPKPTPVPSEF